MHTLDIELTASDIQALNGADAMAASFARLGYHTDARTLQTPANLGMTADGTVRPIKRIELIADQEGLFQLLSAYAIADWSEEFFNNRALFSDYYLLERLPERPQWVEDPKPSYIRLRQLYQRAAARFAGTDREFLLRDLMEPALQALGFDVRPGKKVGSRVSEPDYRLYAPPVPGLRQPGDSPMRALCLVYPWGRSLDSKDDQRDNETPEENPGAAVVSLLEKGEAPWAMVTNGKLWRLYSQRTHSRATNYYEIDLEEVLAHAGPQAAHAAESFRYFWLFFRS